MTRRSSHPLEGKYVFPDLLREFRKQLHRPETPIDHERYVIWAVKHFGGLYEHGASDDEVRRDLQCLWDEVLKTAVYGTNVSPAPRTPENRRQWNQVAQLSKKLRGAHEVVNLWKIPVGPNKLVEMPESLLHRMRIEDVAAGVGTLMDDTLFIPTLEREMFDRLWHNMNSYESLNVFAALATHRTDKDLKWNTPGLLLGMRVMKHTFEEERSLDLLSNDSDKMLLTWMQLPILWIRSHGLHLLKEADADTKLKSAGVEPGALAVEQRRIKSPEMTRERWEFWKQRSVDVQWQASRHLDQAKDIKRLAEELRNEMDKVEQEYSKMSGKAGLSWLGGCAVM